jgi:hypothetical protein
MTEEQVLEKLKFDVELRRLSKHTQDELRNLLNACDNLRDKCMLMTIYGAGLRLSEIACLKVSDIDSKKCSYSYVLVNVLKIDMRYFQKPIFRKVAFLRSSTKNEGHHCKTGTLKKYQSSCFH